MAAIVYIDENFSGFESNVELNTIPATVFDSTSQPWAAVATAGAGDLLSLNSASGHLGIVRVSTGATANNNCSLFLPRDLPASGPLPSEGHVPFFPDFLKMDMWVRLTQISLTKVTLGIGQDLSSATFGTDGFFFDYDTSVSNNWRCVTRSAGAQTVTDTGIAMTVNAWYKLTLQVLTASNVRASDDTSRGTPLNTFRFYINDVGVPPLVANGGGSYSVGAFVHHTTNTPTNLTAGVIGARVQTLTTASRSVDIDRIRYVIDEAAMVS